MGNHSPGPAAKALVTARHLARLTQAQLAAAAGTSPAAISAIESGRRDPTVATLTKLVDACGMTLHIAVAHSPTDGPDDTAIGQALRRTVDHAEATGLPLADVARLLPADMATRYISSALSTEPTSGRGAQRPVRPAGDGL